MDGTLAGSGRGAWLLHVDRDQNILATSYLPGTLVKDHAAAGDVDTYRQAGELPRRLSRSGAQTVGGLRISDGCPGDRLAGQRSPHRRSHGQRLRDAIAGHDHEPAALVPTHGDWQPRNWLIHEGRVSVIDLGRADWRPALTDLARLARQEWQGRPDLEAAFLSGYGSDPREPAAWQRTLLREAIGTAVWAYQVGDQQFEAQGHQMISQALGIG